MVPEILDDQDLFLATRHRRARPWEFVILFGWSGGDSGHGLTRSLSVSLAQPAFI